MNHSPAITTSPYTESLNPDTLKLSMDAPSTLDQSPTSPSFLSTSMDTGNSSSLSSQSWATTHSSLASHGSATMTPLFASPPMTSPSTPTTAWPTAPKTQWPSKAPRPSQPM